MHAKTECNYKNFASPRKEKQSVNTLSKTEKKDEN